jgi:hypothetical protein
MRSSTIGAVLVAAGAAVAAVSAVAPASADPSGGPCGLFSNPLCAFVPILPNLDHDVDLTKDPNALVDGAGTASVPDNTGPAN